MDSRDILKYKNVIIIFFLAVLAGFMLWMRLIPAAGLVTDNSVNLLGNDPWYTLRQIEAQISHFPSYPWFDPMTEYPTGNVIHWGPLFTTIIGAVCIMAGAQLRPDVMIIASWIPPLMAAAMVPVMYLIGRKMGDWKTGILAAAFIAIVSGQFLYRSLFGFVDHHIAEVLFSTLFAFAFISVIAYTRANPISLTSVETLRIPLILSIGAGLAYILGLLTMPTMILFALIVALFTVVQFIWDHYHDRPGDDLLFVNVIVFACAIVGLFMFGLQHEGLSLSRYSMGHIIAYLAVIASTVILWAGARFLHGKPKYYYPLLLAAIAGVGSVILLLAAPNVFEVLIGNFYAFFGEKATTLTIQEAKPWSLDSAWTTFNFGLILMVGGVAALIYKNIRGERADQLFVLVWSAVILFATIRHVRYEYYLAVNVALLSGFFIWFAIETGGRGIASHFTREPETHDDSTEKKRKKGKKGKKGEKVEKVTKKDPLNPMDAVLVGGAAILGVLFIFSSATSGLAISSSSAYGGMNGDWMESLEWMSDHTPETGVDYYTIYDRENFHYPTESYGVMTWWDYGHWITFIAKRIPNANPFQHGVSGENGAAAFFIQQSENDSSAILDNLNTRYVITDIEMDTGKFWAMATWYDEKKGESPYVRTLFNLASTDRYESVRLYNSEYFQTMISRLHNFDGSMVVPGEVYVITYAESSISNTAYPLIKDVKLVNSTEAQAVADAARSQALPGYHTEVLSPLIIQPTVKVPALQHYRLVYESRSSVFAQSGPDLKYVKIFEYVPGAKIRGEGVIEVPLETNTGRTFTYRQESHNGEFIVPYSTSGNTYEVKATGKYTITGTGETFDVSEETIKAGRYIN